VLDVDPVQPAFRNAANLVRSHLLSNQATPEIFRSVLDDIPRRERDGWLDLLWDLDEIPDDDPALPRGCVPYLPCAVATVLEAVQRASVTRDDVFVDVGSGIGRTAFLANLLTGAGCIGLETRQIRVCCVHMPPLERPWLVQLPAASADLDVYRSTPLPNPDRPPRERCWTDRQPG
jgi:hypothetical protein